MDWPHAFFSVDRSDLLDADAILISSHGDNADDAHGLDFVLEEEGQGLKEEGLKEEGLEEEGIGSDLLDADAIATSSHGDDANDAHGLDFVLDEEVLEEMVLEEEDERAPSLDERSQASAELEQALFADPNLPAYAHENLNVEEFFQEEPECTMDALSFMPTKCCDIMHFDFTPIQENSRDRNQPSCGYGDGINSTRRCGSIHQDEDCINNVHSENSIQTSPRKLVGPLIDPLSMPTNQYHPVSPLEDAATGHRVPRDGPCLPPLKASVGSGATLGPRIFSLQRRVTSDSGAAPDSSNPGGASRRREQDSAHGQRYHEALHSLARSMERTQLSRRHLGAEGADLPRHYQEVLSNLAQSMERTVQSRRQLVMLRAPALLSKT